MFLFLFLPYTVYTHDWVLLQWMGNIMHATNKCGLNEEDAEDADWWIGRSPNQWRHLAVSPHAAYSTLPPCSRCLRITWLSKRHRFRMPSSHMSVFSKQRDACYARLWHCHCVFSVELSLSHRTIRQAVVYFGICSALKLFQVSRSLCNSNWTIATLGFTHLPRRRPAATAHAPRRQAQARAGAGPTHPLTQALPPWLYLYLYAVYGPGQ